METSWGSWVYVSATIVIGGAYSLWLAKRPELAVSTCETYNN